MNLSGGTSSTFQELPPLASSGFPLFQGASSHPEVRPGSVHRNDCGSLQETHLGAPSETLGAPNDPDSRGAP